MFNQAVLAKALTIIVAMVVILLGVISLPNTAYSFAKDLSGVFALNRLSEFAQGSVNSDKVIDELSIVGTGVTAEQSQRGKMAKKYAATFSKGNKDSAIRVEASINNARQFLETTLQEGGLDENDLGVAYGVSFVTLWSMANNCFLPEPIHRAAIKNMTVLFRQIKKTKITLKQSQKDAYLDYFMTMPIAFTVFKEFFQQQKWSEHERQLDSQMKHLFQQTFQQAHTQFVFTMQGELLTKTLSEQTEPSLLACSVQ